jgi:biopolymer transport protein ExbD
MSDIKKIYTASLRECRQEAKTTMKDAERAYLILKNKDSEYGRIVKAMAVLHRKAFLIYENAPNEI